MTVTEDGPDQPADDAPARRIRSFVLRQGRITPAQDRAFAAHWSRYGLEVGSAPRDYDTVFGRRAPRVLEIGFGNGEQMAWSAAHEPEKDLIGVEVHRPGVGRLINALAALDANNARVYHHDAFEVIERDIAPASLDQVRVYFPDPWHKKRHNKRRLIQPQFVAFLATRVRAGGLLHLATDWADYAEQMLAVLEASPDWRNRAGPGQYSARPEWRIQTHFEKRGLRLGHGVWDLLYDRNAP
jgi:tRNA (guanine-N7-)-methyltransferase